jgi:hypothetical protein
LHCGSCDEQRPVLPISQFSGQTVPSHDENVPQETSHAHELLQSMSLHDWLPLHVTLHAPSPQSRFRHELLPLHVTLHESASVQSIPCVHELAVLQPMEQFQPDGQTTLSLQLLIEQSIVQVIVPMLQLEHCAGQVAPSGAPSGGRESATGPSPGRASTGGLPLVTQNPSTHERLGNPLQSDGVLHSYSPLRWLMEQLPMMTSASVIAASQPMTSFTGNLQW